MENNIKIKKILRQIYKIDYSKIQLKSDDEFILKTNGVSEFSQYLKKIDMDQGVIVDPTGYRNGIFFSTENDGELYASCKLLPELVSFGFNIIGVKKGFFYRITVIARDAGTNTLITNDRSLVIADDLQQIVMSADLRGYDKNQEITGFFRANSNDVNLFFTLGKIVIKDIIIDEVVLDEEEKLSSTEQESVDEAVPEGKIAIAAYGVFDLRPMMPDSFNGRYIQLVRITGQGISLTYDKLDKIYLLERDNTSNVIPESFVGSAYIVDINLDKLPNAGIFIRKDIIEVSPGISPTMLKQGYIKFALVDKKEERIPYSGDGRAVITVRKIV
jgi:hypothetical protein